MPTCRPVLDFVKKMVDKQESLLLAVSAIYTSSRKWIKARTGDNRGNGTIAAIRYDKGSNRDGTRL